MKEFSKTMAGPENTELQLINRVSDPSMWILTVYKKILFFRKKIKTYWFYGKDEAERFAENYVRTN